MKYEAAAQLCGQIEQQRLQSLKKPNSVIAISSFVFQKFMHREGKFLSGPQVVEV